jgi:hypothetical protein
MSSPIDAMKILEKMTAVSTRETRDAIFPSTLWII